ncbi:hypothetical protein CK203_028114 [Vitis vinifera]|uniref:DUF659 domain-containing protein n=1 Tax=Vitis vinifera TaxID=29760 RepID=A0A438IM11_VITVI|nr:hypothetical protein CK203_028114 [Vitis vinifera]
MHKDPHNNTKKCPRLPPEVKEEIRLLVHDKQKAKAKKNVDIGDIRSQLRGTMGTHHTHLVNEDDDDEDAEDEDVYMYPTDMHPDEQDAYRSAVCASKASNWEREQHENIVGSKRKSGESSTGISSTMRKSQTNSSFMRVSHPAKAKSHHFKNMIIGAQQAGMGIEPPSPYEIKNKYLEIEYKEMEAYVNQQREKWKTYGCTIMSDGWTGPTKLNNELAFMKAGKQLMKKYNLYWTLCAAHCINLIFEDIGKRPNVIEVINNARKITNFIYNHGWLLAQMRKYCGGDIVRPRATRLTNIVSLYEPLYVVLRLVNSEVVPTMPFVYELMHVMKENLIRQGARDWMFKIIQDRWEKTLKHPLHVAAYFLNPRFQYRRGVGSDPELLQVVHDVFAKLDLTTESLGQFGNELVLFRGAKRGFDDRATIASRSTMVLENDRVAEKDYLDLLDILAKVGEEEDNQLFQWVKPIHLDDEVGNPDP